MRKKAVPLWWERIEIKEMSLELLYNHVLIKSVRTTFACIVDFWGKYSLFNHHVVQFEEDISTMTMEKQIHSQTKTPDFSYRIVRNSLCQMLEIISNVYQGVKCHSLSNQGIGKKIKGCRRNHVVPCF